MPKTKCRAISKRARTDRKPRRRPPNKRLNAAQRDRLAQAAHTRFLKSGAMILDVLGKLDA